MVKKSKNSGKKSSRCMTKQRLAVQKHPSFQRWQSVITADSEEKKHKASTLNMWEIKPQILYGGF